MVLRGKIFDRLIGIIIFPFMVASYGLGQIRGIWEYIMGKK